MTVVTVWCERLLFDGAVKERVRIVGADDGSVLTVTAGVDPAPGDLRVGFGVPGFGNAHSHAFHRALRGRTHDQGGDFWVWREHMYRVASMLTPERYHRLATAVFAEMVAAGYTAVAEFHYLHHRLDGTSYPDEMELALVAAAEDAGIRMRLLDTLYLSGGVGTALTAQQRRFSDGEAGRYLERWFSLSARMPTLGAAVHSLRAVPPEVVARVLEALPASVPLHIHLSEQVRENSEIEAAYGMTPTRLLADLGALSPRLSAVHATHLTDDDIGLLGSSGATVVMCPTTEADLGDGIGPARRLLSAGAGLAVGSDQNAVIDPLLEIRGLEMHERLGSERRGRFSPLELQSAGTAGGYRSLGLPAPLTVNGPFDLVEIDALSIRTVGTAPEQMLLAATSADVQRVIVGGRVAAENGRLADGRAPADLMRTALEELR